ncbi:EAL domain-containing protein [Microvirga brassicacearum]|uniref:EAL domain-containing protein n=1 Tax=Microvirga brassicacearum TaxID=2580413 RepID=A0A5N3P3F8_9HYPH|nr:EAL domain-containing protein [Microvirga brassicacearum]KAB0264254.1 EAL domain-containing protein [Microvirga brassicacearum]
MVETVRHRKWLETGEARLVAGGLTAAAALVVIAYATEIAAATVALMLFHVAALTALAAAWQKAGAAAKNALRNSQELDFLASRLLRLEQQARMPNPGSPVLRSTMAEVTGTVGLLGGVVRELARNVAAQHRDVSDLKDSLQLSPKDGEAERPSLKIVPERRAAATAAPQIALQPDPSLLPVRPAESESEIRRTRLVTQAFEADRVELHLQPVVALPQRKVRFYEALARLRLEDGTLLAPAEFLSHLERLGRAPEFDRRVLTRAIAVARHLVARRSEAIVAVNLSPRSVRDAGFLDSLMALAASAPDIAGKIVLELSQRCWRSLDGDQKEAFSGLGNRGLSLSLDQAPDLAFDARALSDRGIRFLKLPADMLIATAAADNEAEISVRDFAVTLRRAGIKLIADRVEHEDMVPTLIDLCIPLAQGFVFAPPRAVRAEVLEAGQVGPSDLRRAG